MTPLFKYMGVPWLVIKLALSSKSPPQVLEVTARGLAVTVAGVIPTRNTYFFGATTAHKNPDGSTYPATVVPADGGVDLRLVAKGKGVLTNSYRPTPGGGLTITIVMRNETTGAEVVNIRRFLTRAAAASPGAAAAT